MRIIKLKLFCFLWMSVVLISCSKKEIQGPQGDPGTPGGGGNAGISASDIFTVTSTQWQKNADSSAWKYSIITPLITKEIVDKGVVKVFVQTGTSWWELPYTQGDLFTQFGFDLGVANLLFADIHGGLPLRPSTAAYRVITISAVARAANPNTDWGNYYEVSRLIESTKNIK